MLTDDQKAILKRQVSESAKLAQQVMHPISRAALKFDMERRHLEQINSVGPQRDDL